VTEPGVPILSVIVVNWNGAHFLPRCLQSLQVQTLRHVQVILADNGSTDDSVPLTRKDFPAVEIAEFGQNLGYAEANNKAAALSRARYFLFLNNDAYVDADALATLVAVAESHPQVPILAPQQRTYDGSRMINLGVGMDILGYPCQGKVFYSDGASLFIRRDVFERLGGFDPGYFMFAEDADLCWRAWLWGYRVGTVPDAIVFHKAGGTAGSSLVEGNRHTTSKARRRLSHRNQLATLLKNYSLPALCIALPLFAALTAAEVALLVVTGQRAVLTEVYAGAWRDLVCDRARIRAMRRTVQASRRVSDWTILRRMEWTLTPVRLFFRVGMPTIK
jgi:N-acetylglucosaminyl-diphospho-decaprenol L-rhamnosyltransferase